MMDDVPDVRSSLHVSEETSPLLLPAKGWQFTLKRLFRMDLEVIVHALF